MISITTPAPLWATGNPSKHDRQWKPKPDEFALFARAIAARYGSQADQFAILNEPNQPGWLAPQSNKRGFYAPHHYRGWCARPSPRSARRARATRSSSASSPPAAA